MPLTICTCTLNVRDQLGSLTSSVTSELTMEPRKSQVNSGDALYLSRPERAAAINGVITMALSETTTNNQQVVFTLNWDDAGKNSGSILFDPIKIPNQSSVDLSTILTVARG